jgi:hypothetical protein
MPLYQEPLMPMDAELALGMDKRSAHRVTLAQAKPSDISAA